MSNLDKPEPYSSGYVYGDGYGNGYGDGAGYGYADGDDA